MNEEDEEILAAMDEALDDTFTYVTFRGGYGLERFLESLREHGWDVVRVEREIELE